MALGVAPSASLRELVAGQGFAVVEGVLSSNAIAQMRSAIDVASGKTPAFRQRRGATFAIRNLLEVAPCVRDVVAAGRAGELIEHILGPEAFITRAILFDKNPAANWAVPWHQDTTIAVRFRPAIDPPGFGPWSVKAGVHHVQPPAAVLEGMLTQRLHLDDCNQDNGPLRVIPGSHRHGILDGDALERASAAREPVACTVAAGGAVLMKPLLLHASSPAHVPGRRRVVHLEWAAAAPLPHGLEWNCA